MDDRARWHVAADPLRHRVVVRRGACVFDTTTARLLHETKHLPVYYVPDADVDGDLLEPSAKASHCPHKGDARYWSIRAGGRVAPDAVWAYPRPIEAASFLAGHKAFYWKELDEWFAEDERLHGHPRDPYSRIDVCRTSRRVRVVLDGVILADSVRAKALFETGLPTRWYFPREDVRVDLLSPSSTVTRCAYKGLASHFDAGGHADVAWTYADPHHDAEPVRDLIAFYNERADLEVDGAVTERPVTQWSR